MPHPHFVRRVSVHFLASIFTISLFAFRRLACTHHFSFSISIHVSLSSRLLRSLRCQFTNPCSPSQATRASLSLSHLASSQNPRIMFLILKFKAKKKTSERWGSVSKPRKTKERDKASSLWIRERRESKAKDGAFVRYVVNEKIAQ